ncbi:hypothetical protein FMUND_6532, partial [Fusarium mundagurra]
MKVSIALFSVLAGLAVASPAANAKMVERCFSLINEQSDHEHSIDMHGDSSV